MLLVRLTDAAVVITDFSSLLLHLGPGRLILLILAAAGKLGGEAVEAELPRDHGGRRRDRRNRR